MARLARQRRVDGDDVACCQKRVERLAAADAHHLHAEAPRARRDRLTDATHADDPQLLACQRGAEEVQRLPDAAAGRAHFAIAFDDAPHHREDESHRQVRRCLGEHTGGVCDDDSQLPGGIDVDVVVADRVVRDHPQVRIRRQHLARQRIAQQRDGRIGLAQNRDHVVLGAILFGGVLDEVAKAGQDLARNRRVLRRENDDRLHKDNSSSDTQAGLQSRRKPAGHAEAGLKSDLRSPAVTLRACLHSSAASSSSSG